MPRPARSLAAILFAATLALTTGCTASVLNGSPYVTQKPALAEASYAAADMLVQQARSLVTQTTQIQIGALADVDAPGEYTAFGRMVPEQIGARFVQLGYNVAAAGPAGSMVMNADPSAASSYGAMAQQGYGNNNFGVTVGSGPVSQAMITGQYASGKKEVLVSLRVVETGTGRILAAYDYAVPRDANVKELTRTQADKNSLFGL